MVDPNPVEICVGENKLDLIIEKETRAQLHSSMVYNFCTYTMLPMKAPKITRYAFLLRSFKYP